MKVSILGTEYDLIEVEKYDPRIEEMDGLCLFYDKVIYIKKEYFEDDKMATQSCKQERKKFAKRHEIIHAFWNESGLRESPVNEEWAVSLLATQFEKMLKAFQEVKAI